MNIHKGEKLIIKRKSQNKREKERERERERERESKHIYDKMHGWDWKLTTIRAKCPKKVTRISV